jgi:transglutaminase-like putative cysteine protease
MARHLRWLTGALALVLVAARLTRLLQPTTSGPSWVVVVLAMAIMGGVITWVAASYRISWISIASINLVAIVVAGMRVIAPGTLAFGLVPTPETFDVLGSEMAFAAEVFRFGAAPVLPIPGLIAAVGSLFWVLGALVAASAVTGRAWIGSAPALVFYLQLATLDRRSSTVVWIGAFALIATLSILAAGPGADRRTGRLRDSGGMMITRRSGALPAVLAGIMVVSAVAATSAFASTVPEAGSIDWRTNSGIGTGLYGQGSSLNLFVGLQQNVVSLSDEPVFYARVSDSAPDNNELYWRLITLDVFDGENWIPGAQTFSQQGQSRYEREEWQFQGPTTEVSARVRIAALTQQLLPLLYSTTAFESPNRLIDESFRVREDGSIGIDVRSREGWEYEFRANVPDPDIAQLASLGGELSPIFDEAVGQGAIDLEPRPVNFVPRPPEIDPYLELPDDVSLAVRQAARDITEPGFTRFEKALILEAFFRDNDNFVYSTGVSTGHSSLDLQAWLLDPESENFRTGYCEQFATAMAVMARSIGLPSRVVLGFTPGEVVNQEDGSELIVVRERNAHAWVEIWMDGQGWVRFDPTPRSDGINRSLGQQEIGFDARAYVPAPENGDPVGGSDRLPGERDPVLPDFDEFLGDSTPDLRTGDGLQIPDWTVWVAALIVAAGVLPAYKTVRRRRRLAAVAAGNIEVAWVEITDRLRDLGSEVGEDLTPIEIASARHPDLVPLARIYSAIAYGGSPIGDGRRAFEVADSRLSEQQGATEKIRERVALGSIRRR